MTRKLCAMTLAAAVAGGVYLAAAQPAAASNMGFKLERNFEPVEVFDNLFYVSFPLFNGLGDIADSTDPTNIFCVDAGGTGDGVINAADAICDMYDGSGGVFSMSRYNIDTCGAESLTARPDAFNPGELSFSGEWLDPLPRDEAFQVEQTFQAGANTVNPAVIVGSHDPSYTGRTIAPNGACRGDLQIALINLPYHTMYQNAIEILCGLEGVHWERDGMGDFNWFDLDGNGTVEEDEQCGAGIWDTETNMSINWFDNVDDNSGPAGRDTDGAFLACSVLEDPFDGTPSFGDPDCYDLIPGEGYIVQMTTGHTPTTFLSPHF